jgi:hypothetical protein
MIVFAVALLVTVGFFNMIDGIAAIANSHVFIANAHQRCGALGGAGTGARSGPGGRTDARRAGQSPGQG